MFQVRLTFGQTLHQVDIWPDVTPKDDASDEVDIRSDFRSGSHLVRCTPQHEVFSQFDIWSDVPSKR